MDNYSKSGLSHLGDEIHEVTAALIVQSGKILLGLRSATRTFYPGVWDLFGGHVEAGERHEQTLNRELQEELGITPTEWRFLETLRLPLATLPPALMTVHLYLVTAWTGTPYNRQPEEHSVIHWFSQEEAKQLPLADPIYPSLFERYIERE
jgi:8-oxo-dGTP diphosphatase